jgi:hypothetical protein
MEDSKQDLIDFSIYFLFQKLVKRFKLLIETTNVFIARIYNNFLMKQKAIQ